MIAVDLPNLDLPFPVGMFVGVFFLWKEKAVAVIDSTSFYDPKIQSISYFGTITPYSFTPFIKFYIWRILHGLPLRK